MKITYDDRVDVLYIQFKDTKTLSQHVRDEIVLDFDVDEHLAGIEILDASRVLADPAALARATFEQL